MPITFNRRSANQKIEPGDTGLLRTAAAVPVRSAEQVAGLPGNILSGLDLVGKTFLPSYTEQSEKDKFSESIPTSDYLRKNVTQKFTGQALEPQGWWERKIQDIAGDFTGLLLGGAGTKGGIGAVKALKLATGGNVAQEIAETLGAGDFGQGAAKFGYMALAGTFGGRQRLADQMRQEYSIADQIAANPNLRVSAKKIEPILAKVDKWAYSGDLGSPSKTFIRPRLEFLKNAIAGGKMNLSDVWNLKKDWGEILRTKGVPSTAKFHMQELLEGLGQKGVMGEYGKKNRKFGNAFSIAEDIRTGLGDNSFFGNFLGKHKKLEKIITNPTLKQGMFGTALLTLPHITGPSATLALGGAYIGRETYKLYHLLSKSDAALNAYIRTIGAALKSEPAVFAKEAAKLNRIADKFENQQPAVTFKRRT